MGVFKLEPMDLMFIDGGVKINGAYYREVLLTQKLLPVMREICGEFFIFRQGNVTAYRACETKIFWNETPAFISPDLLSPNSTYLNPVHYKKIWG